MFRNTFLKTLYEKRWTILIWFIATLLVVFGLSMLFPPIRDMMGSMMNGIPDSMKGWFGTSDIWSSFSTYSAQEIFGEFALLPAVMAIVLGVGLLAGEERSGRILAVLSRPVRRLNYYVAKWLVLFFAVLISVVGLYVGVVVAGLILGVSVPFDSFALCSLSVFLHALAIGTITYAIGAIFASKAAAGVVVGFYLFLAYFIQSLSTAAPIVDDIAHFSLFRYIDAQSVLASGLSSGNILIFILAIAVPLLISAPIFIKRDLKTR